jgi:4-diphosphocytidyl-2-C-methyl-D-erythritol kinase
MALRSLYDVPAPAKLNLFLHVVGRRPDGYHLLQSVFVLIDWCDQLHFERRDDGLLQRHDLGPALPADDLCLRAARALQAASGCSLGADISIDKQLPWGAGMGGGSSDAASTLLALNQLWDLQLPQSRLLELALALGADVPFFVRGQNAWVEGIGEQITPIALPEEWFAVVKPEASIDTKAIFSSPLLVRDTEAAILTGFLARNTADQLIPAFGRNDLQPPAEASCPEVAEAGAWLGAIFGNSRMTGSGSAVFARAGRIVNDDGTERAPVATLPQALPAGKSAWATRMCRSLKQHPLVGWSSA